MGFRKESFPTWEKQQFTEVQDLLKFIQVEIMDSVDVISFVSSSSISRLHGNARTIELKKTYKCQTTTWSPLLVCR